ncbi:shikimate dehydrogenase family protein [Hymenobacter latericus]|uniref:shikimate dehydrogenase family protein n=1 Tax=Hymenobacter sp. YIM 151858-1 TaxID=2987688 RepID=UPI002228034C|nr:shikimate dehydrogenase [Hymenobacter sp. YIM 151858-1]UYZ58841.1 shikimate dehydrogenase [Hymenobacter sp. YIM 151858-1]
MAREFGLIGKSLVHSFSPTYFFQKFQHLGLRECTYEAFELEHVRDLPALVAGHPNLQGLNVTIPYKEQILPYLDALDSSAARIGAVNVIQFDADRRLIGHNTDYVGFRDSLRRFYPLRGDKATALVLGTGGASKAVEVALRELDIHYWLVSRDRLTAGLTYAELTPELMAAHTLIINTTPLGTYPRIEECPAIPYEALTPQHYLFDLVYNPSETEFMRRGRAQGAQAQNGFEMLCLQAEAAWAIWNR